MEPFTEQFAGFRWPVHAEQRIAASTEKVWKAISEPGNLERCHPFCERNPVLNWPGANARDEVHYLSGLVYERQFDNWIEGVGYDLEIGKPGEDTSRVSWRIVSVEPEVSILRITVYPYVLQDVPLAVRGIPHVLWLRPLLGRYLSAVTRGFEWFVTKGQPVPRNQFGRHPWYSGRTRRHQT